MPIVIIAFLLTAFNIVMWVIFALRFKKLFSTDDILERTRKEIKEMLSDINRTADRNILLIDERIKQLKAVSAEADRHLGILKKELAKVESTQAFEAKLEAVKKSQEEEFSSKKNKVSSVPSKSKTASLTSRYMQGDLFITEKAREELSIAGENALQEEGTLTKNAERIRLIPIVEPEIFTQEKMIEVKEKKDFRAMVKELHDLGESDEAIAAKLGRSVTEVKFSLEF